MKTLLFCLGIFALSGTAFAKKSSCEDIKPAQSLLTEEAKTVAAGAAAAVPGSGVKGSAKLKVEKEKTYETRLLDDETLAQAWFKYTQCVETSGNTAQRAMAMKEMGMTPEEYAQWAAAFQTEANQSGSSMIMIGGTATGVGIALGAGTYFYGKNNNRMDEGPWGVLTALNVTGWTVAGAGAGMITYAMLKKTSSTTLHPTLGGLSLSGQF
jgi:hypothetical protein